MRRSRIFFQTGSNFDNVFLVDEGWVDPNSTIPHDTNQRVIRTYILKKVVTGNTQSEHLFKACTACPDTKINILNHGPRLSNGLDTDHD